MVLDNYRKGETAMSSIKSSDQKINLIDETAVVSVNLEMTGKYNDQISIFKGFVHIWSGTGYLTGKPLIKPYLSGVFGSINFHQKYKIVCIQVVSVRVQKWIKENQKLSSNK